MGCTDMPRQSKTRHRFPRIPSLLSLCPLSPLAKTKVGGLALPSMLAPGALPLLSHAYTATASTPGMFTARPWRARPSRLRQLPSQMSSSPGWRRRSPCSSWWSRRSRPPSCRCRRRWPSRWGSRSTWSGTLGLRTHWARHWQSRPGNNVGLRQWFL